jgi:hypothetical protein
MHPGWTGLLVAALCVSEGYPLDVDVGIAQSGATSARIRIFHSPAKEPLGAIRVRLKLRPQAVLSAFTNVQPDAGPWSQFLPQVARQGNDLVVWAMAPNVGASEDSASRLIADLPVEFASTGVITTAQGLIDSVIVEEAFTPFGKKTVIGGTMATTGLRMGKDIAGPGAVERIHGRAHTLDFTLSQSRRVKVYVADIRGKRIATILDRKLPAGMHEASWNGTADGGRPLTAGTYFLRLEAGTYAYDRKLEVAP